MSRAAVVRPADAPIFQLHRASQSTTAALEAKFRSAGLDLTVPQYAILEALAVAAGASQTVLSERTGIDRSTLSEIMRRLVKKGIVARRRTTADKRTYSGKLTAAGKALYSSGHLIFQAANAQLLESLPNDLREPFLTALGHFVAHSDTSSSEKA